MVDGSLALPRIPTNLAANQGHFHSAWARVNRRLSRTVPLCFPKLRRAFPHSHRRTIRERARWLEPARKKGGSEEGLRERCRGTRVVSLRKKKREGCSRKNANSQHTNANWITHRVPSAIAVTPARFVRAYAVTFAVWARQWATPFKNSPPPRARLDNNRVALVHVP